MPRRQWPAKLHTATEWPGAIRGIRAKLQFRSVVLPQVDALKGIYLAVAAREMLVSGRTIAVSEEWSSDGRWLIVEATGVRRAEVPSPRCSQ